MTPWGSDAAHGFGMQTVPIAGGVRIPDRRAIDAAFLAGDAAVLARGGAKVAKWLANAATEGPPVGSLAAQRGAIFPHDILKALSRGETRIEDIATTARSAGLGEAAVKHMQAIDAAMPQGDAVIKTYTTPGGKLEWRAGDWQNQGERHLAAGDGMYLREAGYANGQSFMDNLDWKPRTALERWIDERQPRRQMYVFRDVKVMKDGKSMIPSITVDADDGQITNVVLRRSWKVEGKAWEPEGYKKQKPGD